MPSQDDETSLGMAAFVVAFSLLWNGIAWWWTSRVVHDGFFNVTAGKGSKVIRVVSLASAPHEFWSAVVVPPAIGALFFLFAVGFFIRTAWRRRSGAG